MSESFLGEIRMFAGNFAPRGNALCDGQLLAVAQYDALFSLFGTIYGGDGRTTFGLPDLRGRIPIHRGAGPGLTPRKFGQRSGTEKVTLTAAQLPAHNHGNLQATKSAATSSEPGGKLLAPTQGINAYRNEIDDGQDLADAAVTSVGGGEPHTNLMPFQCINFIVALYGIYPSRS